MTAAHAPGFIVNHPDKTVRSILYVCWVATFNTPEHHMGLPLAQSQVRCMLFACNDGRNANLRDFIDAEVGYLVSWLSLRRAPQIDLQGDAADAAFRIAQQLARLSDMAVTP